MIKLGNLIKRDCAEVCGNSRGSFGSETFYNGYKNLIQMPKFLMKLIPFPEYGIPSGPTDKGPDHHYAGF
jgi:hypothetical protein